MKPQDSEVLPQTLDDMLDTCPPGPIPLTEEDREWLEMPDVGKEILDGS